MPQVIQGGGTSGIPKLLSKLFPKSNNKTEQDCQKQPFRASEN